MKRKCQIIPIEVYDKTPIVYEDNNWRYSIGPSGHLVRLRRKTCSLCSQNVSFVIIFEHTGHFSVERYCRDHSATFTDELPETPPPEELTNKQKLALEKWINIKVNI
ncbi:MAG: hypothetical protein WBN72_07420 [Nitrososphaeraceae archaeon]